MFRYIKAAFNLKQQIPGIGAIPINKILLLGFMILGFGLPAFWFLGAAFEAAFLFLVASNPRFQRYVNATDPQWQQQEAETLRQQLIAQLKPDARKKLSILEAKHAEMMSKYRDSQVTGYIADSNSEAVRKLIWVYLKLLVARHHLTSLEGSVTEQGLQQEINSLEIQLQNEKFSDTIRESKTATLKILQKRLSNLQRKEEWLKEIDSDLSRIEAQVDLAVENATLQGQPEALSADIGLYSHVLDEGFFGDSESTIASLEKAYN